MDPIQELLEPDDEVQGSSSLRSMIISRLNSAHTRRSPEAFKLLDWLEEKQQIIQTVYASHDQFKQFYSSSEAALDSLTKAHDSAMAEAKKTIVGLQKEVAELKLASVQGGDLGLRMCMAKEIEKAKAEGLQAVQKLKAEVKKLQEERRPLVQLDDIVLLPSVKSLLKGENRDGQTNTVMKPALTISSRKAYISRHPGDGSEKLSFSQVNPSLLEDAVSSLCQKLETDESLLKEMSGGQGERNPYVRRLEVEIERLNKTIAELKSASHLEASKVSEVIERPSISEVQPSFEVLSLQKQIAHKDSTIEKIMGLGAEREAELSEELTRLRSAYDKLLELMDTRETAFTARIEDLTQCLSNQPTQSSALIEELQRTVALLSADKESTAMQLQTVREQWAKSRKEEISMLKQEVASLKTFLAIKDGELDKLTYTPPSEASAALESCKKGLEMVGTIRNALCTRASKLEQDFQQLDHEYRGELLNFTSLLTSLVDELGEANSELALYKSQGQETQLILLTSQLKAAKTELEHCKRQLVSYKDSLSELETRRTPEGSEVKRLQEENSSLQRAYSQQQEFHSIELKSMQELVEAKTDKEVKLTHKLKYLHTIFTNSLRLASQQPCLNELSSVDSSVIEVSQMIATQEVLMLKAENDRLQCVITELKAVFKQDRLLMSQEIDRLREQLVNVDKRIGEFVRKIESEYKRVKEFSAEIAVATAQCTGETEKIMKSLRDTSTALTSLQISYKATTSQVCAKLTQESKEVTQLLRSLRGSHDAQIAAYKESVNSSMPHACMDDFKASLSDLNRELEEAKNKLREADEMHRQEVAGLKADFIYQLKIFASRESGV